MNKLLRYIVLVGIFLVPFVPLVVSSSMFFPFITGKNFMFRIIVGIIFGAWLWLCYLDKEARPKKSGLLWAVGAYFGVMTLATIFSVNPLRSFWSNFERMEGMATYLHLFAYFLVVSSVVNTKKLWSWLLHTSIFVSVAVSIYGLSQLFGGLAIHQSGTRLDATLGNSAYLAVYLLFHIFLLGYLYFSSKKDIALRYTYASLAILETVILFYTETRGTVLGLIGGIGIALLIFALFGEGRGRKVAIWTLSAVVLAVAIFIGVKDTTFVKNTRALARLSTISLTEGTVKSRFMIWGMSWQGAKEHPVLGWGPENFPYVFQKYYDPKMYGNEPWFDRSHNVFFDQMISGGLLGLLAYLSIFAAAFYYIWKRGVLGMSFAEKTILTGLLAAYFFHNLFVFDNIVSYILFFTLLGYVQFVATENVPAPQAVPIKKKNTDAGEDAYGMVVGLCSIGLVIFSVYFFSIRGMTVSQTLIQALSTSDASVVLSDFQKIFSYKNVVGLSEAREQLLTRTQNLLSASKSDPTTVKAFTDLIGTQMAEQVKELPDDARTYLFYGSFFQTTGQLDRAIEYFKKAEELSPKKQMIKFALAGAYLNKGDKNAALAKVKEAYDLEPSYPEAKRTYVIMLFMTGDTKKANDLLSGPDRKVVINDDRFVNLFGQMKDYRSLAEIWQIRVDSDQTNKQTRASYITALIYAGERDRAIEQVKILAEMEPAFAAQSAKVIEDIKAGRMPQ